METLDNKLLTILNDIDKEYYALRLPDKRSYMIMNIYDKVLGTITPYLVGEKGAYIDFDNQITDLSLDELIVITKMVSIVDEYEKQI